MAGSAASLETSCLEERSRSAAMISYYLSRCQILWLSAELNRSSRARPAEALRISFVRLSCFECPQYSCDSPSYQHYQRPQRSVTIARIHIDENCKG